eukprot:1045220-Pelagomonas_calceolata.AAC.1
MEQPRRQAYAPPSNHPSRIQQQKSWASYQARRLKKSNLQKAKRLTTPTHRLHLPTFDQPCVNGAWPPKK